MSVPRWPAVALGASAATYSSWLLAPWLNPRLGLRTGLASDLAATDQPFHELFRVGDLVAGSLALAGSVKSFSRGPRVAWALAGVFGAATILDASLAALPCAPSVDPDCPAILDAGFPGALVDPHTLTSTFAVLGGLGSSLAFWWAARGVDRRWAAALGLGSVVINAGLLVELLRGSRHEAVWQRIELVNLAAWLVYAAVRSQQRA